VRRNHCCHQCCRCHCQWEFNR